MSHPTSHGITLKVYISRALQCYVTENKANFEIAEIVNSCWPYTSNDRTHDEVKPYMDNYGITSYNHSLLAIHYQRTVGKLRNMKTPVHQLRISPG